MDRQDFLARVRSRLGTPAPAVPVPAAPVPATPIPAAPIPAPPTAELARRFAGELAAVGGHLHLADSPAAARQRLVDLFAELGVRRVLRGRLPVLDESSLDAELERAGHEVTVAELVDGTSRQELRSAAFEADVGLTAAGAGVAETGTLALLSRPGQGRAVSLLPPVHVAVLRADDLVPDLGALFAKARAAGELPSALTLITGPSRTADIELVLTIGIHGPEQLHVVLVATDL